MKEIAKAEGFLPGHDLDCEYYRDVHQILSTAVQHAWLSTESLSGGGKSRCNFDSGMCEWGGVLLLARVDVQY